MTGQARRHRFAEALRLSGLDEGLFRYLEKEFGSSLGIEAPHLAASEYSDQRIRRVLEHIGLSASDYDLETGQTLLAASGNLAGQTPLEHINLAAEVEGGKFFALPTAN